MEQLAASPDYAGCMWGVVELDPARLDNTVERVNISLPRRVIARLDALAASTGTSRSGLIATLAMTTHV